ncbi:MAG: class I tRNA ligase family protein, partial [Puniceicoccales bacterium]|nr:class I tRNA ligase family protein [Puniceicoccales bacterium]
LCRYNKGQVPEIGDLESYDNELIDLWIQTQIKVLEAYDQLQFHNALENIFIFIRAINKFLEMCTPWKLAKSEAPKDQSRLRTVLALCAEAMRLAATILAPILPTVSSKILAVFQISAVTWGKSLTWDNHILTGRSITTDALILFPRIT